MLHSLNRHIYVSFVLLLALFVISGSITITFLSRNQRLSRHIREIQEPSRQGLVELENLLLQSRRHTTEWLLLGYRETDRVLLKQIQDSSYVKTKNALSGYAQEWSHPGTNDTLQALFEEIELLFSSEKEVMGWLNDPVDFTNPVNMQEAKRELTVDVLPAADQIEYRLEQFYQTIMRIHYQEDRELETSSLVLKRVILLLTLFFIIGGFFLARNLSGKLVRPVRRIREMVESLAKGIPLDNRISHTNGEIGQTVVALEKLSGKMRETALFAHETGARNFNAAFSAVSEDDVLGKALLAMRDNLRMGEEVLAQKNRQLEQKNIELEQFAYVASHDLQEPLRTTAGFVELIQKRYKGKLDEKGDKYLEFIQSSTDRMKILIRDLLEYSRIGRSKEREEVDCDHIIRDLRKDLCTIIQETGTVISCEQLPVIYGYPTELKQLFQNLVLNSIKFRKKDTAPRIRISVYRTESGWKFRCADNGIGIDKQYWERIFVIFQRLHNRSEYEGSGIGLANCRKIVELHGGSIWVESVPGAGSSFYFTLPDIHPPSV